VSEVQRIAGVDGTFPYTVNVVPFSAPTMTVYRDALRTDVAVAPAALTATANPAVFTAAYPATLAPGSYYLQFETVFTSGQPALVDADDTLLLLSAGGAVGPAGDVDTVRLLISDVGDPPIFTDLDIEAFLAMEGESIKLAAAQALDSIASNEALVSKRIRTLDLQTDGPAVAKSLREHATALRDQVVGGEFEVTTGLGTRHLIERGYGTGVPELTEWPYY
jgi:hypothetical protein